MARRRRQGMSDGCFIALIIGVIAAVYALIFKYLRVSKPVCVLIIALFFIDALIVGTDSVYSGLAFFAGTGALLVVDGFIRRGQERSITTIICGIVFIIVYFWDRLR